MDLLTVENLSIVYRTRRGCLTAVDGVSFSLARGRCMGLVGESGSGKTTIGIGALGLLPKNAEVTSGRILLEGQDLLGLSPEALRSIRWKKMAMIFQAAMNAMNPIQRVEDQIMEAILTHFPHMPRDEAQSRVAELFSQVGIPEQRRKDYPHQFSGGMRQRAVIAMALACSPGLIIADEPTTALDVIVQDQILKLLRRLRDDSGMSILLITHDIAVAAEVCDDIGVLYAGQIVELGSRHEIFDSPWHPYTRALLNDYITIADPPGEAAVLTGKSPDPIDPGKACRFNDRCRQAEKNCREQPPTWKVLSPTHRVRCCR